jgi:hypothetical protein
MSREAGLRVHVGFPGAKFPEPEHGGLSSER